MFGVEVHDIGRGRSKASVKAKKWMLNFHGVVHGGMIFSLADTAFAAASNSYGTKAVAMNFEIAYRRPGLLGDTLTATATEESRGEKSALYHIKVVNQGGKTVAICHGTVFKTGEKF